MSIPSNAFPEPLSSGVTYLSFTEISENSSKSVSHLINGAAEEFELIIIDLPRHFSEFTNSLISKITMLNLIGVSGIESVRSLNRLRKSSINIEISKLLLRTTRTSNLSAKESSYQMGFDTVIKLPESESVQNLETYGVLPPSKDALMKILQNFVSINL
jgi:cellulose biosynthesis protein BcsQ